MRAKVAGGEEALLPGTETSIHATSRSDPSNTSGVRIKRVDYCVCSEQEGTISERYADGYRLAATLNS